MPYKWPNNADTSRSAPDPEFSDPDRILHLRIRSGSRDSGSGALYLWDLDPEMQDPVILGLARSDPNPPDIRIWILCTHRQQNI